MSNKILKDQKYSNLIRETASNIPCDDDPNFDMTIPEWANMERFKKAQLFFFLNLNASIRGIFLGLLQIIPEQTIFQVLEFTKGSSTPRDAYRRYTATNLHGKTWGSGGLSEGSKAIDSLKFVRKLHYSISKRSSENGTGIISQKDMVITQFAFIGMQLLKPEILGLHGTRNQFENFAHYWRILGYLLGIQDRFNLCTDSYDETLSRIETIRVDFLLPNLTNMRPEIENYLNIAMQGFQGFAPWLHQETSLFLIKRLVGVEGYHYHESEVANQNCERIYNRYNFLTRFRISLSIFMYESFVKFLPFRLFWNFTRIFTSIFTDIIPIFAMMKFGRQHAKVEILKGRR